MKKTIQTMMTAAMFAATVNMIPSGTSDGISSASAVDYNPAIENWQGVYGPPVDYSETTTSICSHPLMQTTTETINTVPVTVYGPPVSWTTTGTSEMTTQTTTYSICSHPLIETTVTTEEPVCVYGPPIAWTTTPETDLPVLTTTVTTEEPVCVYGPPIAWVGDINEDNRVDVFDMIELRKAYIEGVPGDSNTYYRADINKDGKIGIADMVMLQNYLLGRTKKIYDNQIEDPKTTTSTQTSYQPVQTTTEPVPQPEYGAPIAFFE